MGERREKTYRCAACEGEFEFDPEWSDEDAVAESVENFGTGLDDGAIVCDDCYRSILGLTAPEAAQKGEQK